MSLLQTLKYRPPPPSARALRLHRETPVADLHVDCLLTHRLFGYDVGKRHRPRLPLSPFVNHYDIPRAQDAGVQIWGLGLVCAPWPPPEKRAARIDDALNYLERLESKHADKLFRIRDCASLETGLAAGKIGALPGIEGAHALGGDLGRLDHFIERGIRYLGLAHFSANQAAHCAAGYGSSTTKGLSDFGRRLVERLETNRIIVDLAHVNKPGFMETCRMLSSPPIVSHTGVTGVLPHWRNIDDEQIEAVARLGGVVGIMTSPKYIGGRNLSTLEKIADAVEHVRRVAGVKHVAIGSDMDGWLLTQPLGLRDATDWPHLTEILIGRGWRDEELTAFLGGNALRVLQAVLPAGKGEK